MSQRGQVLVAIMNESRDLAIAREKHWYRIPVPSVNRFLKTRWPPEWLAFYQTTEFGEEAFAVTYFARVLDVREVARRDLFPDEVSTKKAERKYFQLMLAPLEKLPNPILSRRWRRIVFIPTTLEKFAHAVEINDLYDESPLEDRLWAALKLLGIRAERQEFVNVGDQLYALDFAIYCKNGNLDIETDGDTYHTDPERVPQDNRRHNNLLTAGWTPLRFNTKQIQEELLQYCVPKIDENIKRLGGFEQTAAHDIDPSALLDWHQLLMFDSELSVPYKATKRKKKTKRSKLG